MDIMADDTAVQDTAQIVDKTTDTPEPPEQDLKLVAKLQSVIKGDKRHHHKAFERMKRDMFVAMHGREETYAESNYKANIAGRHVKQKTGALYAKNPKATARRTQRLDFAVWDEDPQTLMLAGQTIQQGNMLLAAQAAIPPAPPTMPGGLPVGSSQGDNVAGAMPIGPMAGQPMADPMVPADPGMMPPADPMASLAPFVDPMMGHNGGPPMPAPEMPPGYEQAQAMVADFTQGMARRKLIDKIGKTLEILFARALLEQKPLDFKMAAKQMVRRTCTTGVGYCELGFQREYGPRPAMTEQLADAKARLDHLQRLQKEATEGDIEEGDAEMAELQAAIAALQQEPEVLIREGLIFDFPRSTKVIPDRLCKTLVGFIGARHITLEYDFTVDEVEEMFGVDIGKDYIGYTSIGDKDNGVDQAEMFNEDGDIQTSENKGNGLVRVWKHYDKPSGLVYYLADGYKCFLKPPGPPDVFVEEFWPVYALTFNEVESEKELFPPSDVTLLIDMQREKNRSRQGKREHREAARPRWGYSNAAIDEKDRERIGKAKPFDAIGLNIDPATKLADVLQSFPVPGVDPNLYDDGEIMEDMQLVVGTQEATLGGLSKATATESAISANSSASSDSSSIDDLDAFLTCIARSSGQILLKEMSEEQVKAIVGPGAIWPHLTLAEIAGELYLEVEAGSTGKPNQAVEIHNWQTLLPMVMQIPGVNPIWLLKETLRRLDDKLDLTDAIAAGLPSIVAQNGQKQPGEGEDAPHAQGQEGGNNGPKPPGKIGSGPQFESNQV